MISFTPIVASRLLGSPDGVSARANQQLPWSSGSLMPAKLGPATAPGLALLIIGSFRLHAKIPPNTAMGDVWLQILHREMPAKFRILSNAQAREQVRQMLRKQGKRHGKIPSHLIEKGWGKLAKKQLPFDAELAQYGQKLLLQDRHDDNHRILLSQSVDTDDFCLSGRVDLRHLGHIAFKLEGEKNTDWLLDIFIANPRLFSGLKISFIEWLKRKKTEHDGLKGEVCYGIPDFISAQDNIRA